MHSRGIGQQGTRSSRRGTLRSSRRTRSKATPRRVTPRRVRWRSRWRRWPQRRPIALEAAQDYGEPVTYQIVPTAPPVNPADVDSSESAVEVMVMWGDLSILHVEHLSPPRSYLRGRSHRREGQVATDFLIGSESIGTERLPVAIESGSSVAAVIPQGATGDVTINNQRITFEELAAQGQLQGCGELAGASAVSAAAGRHRARPVPRLHLHHEADVGRAPCRRRAARTQLERLRLDVRVHGLPRGPVAALLLPAAEALRRCRSTS